MRLIDADTLKDRASEHSLCKTEYEDFCKNIDDEPTIYDVNGVVQKLVERKKQALDDHAIYGMATSLGKAFGLDDAIEIVKAGGKNDK